MWDRETQSVPNGASASLSKNTREMLEEGGKGISFLDEKLQKNEKEREKIVTKQSTKLHQNKKICLPRLTLILLFHEEDWTI